VVWFHCVSSVRNDVVFDMFFGCVFADEAAGTGCALDIKRVWSGTRAGCIGEMAASQAGSGMYLDKHAIQCTNFSTKLSVRCCADVYSIPCENDECSTRANPLNQCFREGSSYQCQCAGNGWLAGALRQECIPPADPCLAQADPCNSKWHPENRCQVDQQGAIQCICAEGWRASAGSTCVPCSKPCSSDPCAVGSTGNECQENAVTQAGGCDAYSCICRAQGYVDTPAQLSCLCKFNFCLWICVLCLLCVVCMMMVERCLGSAVVIVVLLVLVLLAQTHKHPD
jgi:hypothetical protein